MRKILTQLTFGLFLSAMPLSAAELVYGIGSDDVDGPKSGTPTALFEYHTDPWREFSWGSVAGMAAVQTDSDRDVWLGVGISSIVNLSPSWFIEGSFAAGYYDGGNNGNDLGGKLEFRTLVGTGYRFNDRHRLSVAVDHISNGGLSNRNPGRNSVFLRYGLSF
ncbi:acyloxyacyl hydrolase [Oceaniglobus indicus]|uniref:acyloxyacyl hydrolase n=1 Tax=Oceaniglobus indicus TaxID=2047749 RepID=UPI000C196E09|nr:acyloxyacyl hydrolase [Oceaniglobus indicus]